MAAIGDLSLESNHVSPAVLLARLARHAECPIHGVRIVRLPDGNRFRGEITEPIEPARDAEGRIDVQGTMQAITAIVEACGSPPCLSHTTIHHNTVSHAIRRITPWEYQP